MAYPYSTPQIVSPSNLLDLLFILGHALNDEGVTIDETSDGSAREVPPGGDLDNSTNQWQPGGTLTGFAWVAGRFKQGDSANRCGFFLQYNGSFIIADIFPIAADQWVAGGGSLNAPTKPTLRVSAANFAGTLIDSAIVTDGTMLSIVNLGGSTRCGYLGELSPVQAAANDPQPFALYSGTSGWQTGSGWQRISPVDDTTMLTGSTNVPATIGDCVLDHSLYPVAVGFNNATHAHLAGYAKHSAVANTFTGTGAYTYSPPGETRTWVAYDGSFSGAVRHDGSVQGTELTATPLDFALRSGGYSLVRRAPFMVRARP